MDRNKNRNASVIFSYSPRISKTVEVSSVWAGGWWESTSRAQRRESGRDGLVAPATLSVILVTAQGFRLH